MVLNKTARRFVVLGGAGAIGRIIVRDLYESNSKNEILIADYDGEAARPLARGYRSKRVTHGFADARYVSRLITVLRDQSVVINCTRHQLNLNVMEAALRARVHYLDLGGLFIWTRRQLRFHRPFSEAGLTAILGMGCAPGLTNVMAAAAAAQLERVDSIRIRVGGIDFNARNGRFAFPYAAQTVVEELTLPPWKWSGGRFVQVEPRTGWERVDFGKPVGRIWTVMTRHSEIATLPIHFKGRGLRYADFKIGFDRQFVRELMKRMRAGWSVRDFETLPVPRSSPNDYEIARVIVQGGKNTSTIDCHARSNASWHASAGDIDTACPASIAAQMIANGTIDRRGVWAPEDIVSPELLFKQLRRRGVSVQSLAGAASG
jgi:saccharopine dehydrogenase-like NADP-dependent oxidoreductase